MKRSTVTTHTQKYHTLRRHNSLKNKRQELRKSFAKAKKDKKFDLTRALFIENGFKWGNYYYICNMI